MFSKIEIITDETLAQLKNWESIPKFCPVWAFKLWAKINPKTTRLPLKIKVTVDATGKEYGQD